MTSCLNQNRKLFQVFPLIVSKYARFQKGLGQLTDHLSDVVESRLAVFSNSFSGKRSAFDPQKREHFQNSDWLGSICAALSSLVVVSPLFWGDEYWQPPPRSNSQEITLTNLKNCEPYTTKTAFKSELAGLTSHFENEISAKIHHIRVIQEYNDLVRDSPD